jgi:acyl-CoA hydrolase/RimJ/RimL family protein N-acetyltransferase
VGSKEDNYNTSHSYWLAQYKEMVVPADEAISRIRPEHRVFIGSGCGQPQVLVDALLARAEKLEDIEIIQLLTLSEPIFRHAELSEHFRLNRFFSAEWADDKLQTRHGEHTPVFLSDIPRMFKSGRLPIDVALVQVTPPNEQGMCSLGVSVDVTKSAVEAAGLVIAQVNPQMPWTMGDSLLHIYNIDMLVAGEALMPFVILPRPTKTSHTIAEYIAALISDGSTVELGICGVSLALSEFLQNKHDLGIHAEVIGDGIIELLDSGVVTGLHKSVDRGKVVGSICLGTQKLYDYVDRNPTFSFRPSESVSDPGVIAQQQNMIAVVTAEEVDLTGQVCARTPRHGVSGIDIRADFVHGTAKTKHGRLIIAIESTLSDGSASKIVSCLSRGAEVVATSREVHYVVTEYGVAYLNGKSLQERAMSLISVAHPNFRENLLRDAIVMNLVNPSLADVEGRFHILQPELKARFVLDDGTLINIRPMHPTDENRVRGLFQSLSEQTKYYRFMSQITKVPQKQIQNFVYIDYRSEMAIVGTIPEADGDRIIAIGRYFIDPRTNRAEVAFVVHDEWQNRGIGTFMFKLLIKLARQNGIEGFSAEVLIENKAMLAVFYKGDCKISSSTEGRVRSVNIDFV